MFHILLVEDNPSDVLLIREAMRRSSVPADVVIAYDGERALALLRGVRFHLVILDLNVPKFSGHTILEQCRVLSDAPVVVMSGVNNPIDKEMALGLGAKEYVVKPQSFEGFIRAVHGMLERWRQNSSAGAGSK
jgi:DNA-binding response OmpR family regulator